MSPDIEESLYRRWPEIFREKDGDPLETGMRFGVQCGDGWAPLIDALCSVVDAHARTGAHRGPAAKAVKQKTGSLRVRLSGSCEFCAGAVEMVRVLSERVSEVTGEPLN